MTPAPAAAALAAPPLSCFVVEDSPVIRQNLADTLAEMSGVQVVGMAEDEAQALAWLQQGHDCRLFIVDIFLRRGTGLQVLRHARATHPQATLVVLTNYATADMRRRCLELGADRVFDKSAELDELLAFCAQLAPPGPV